MKTRPKQVSAQYLVECGLLGYGRGTPPCWAYSLTVSHLKEAQCVSGDSSTAALHCVVDELVRFRLKVRQYALATPGATGAARRQQLQERQPLLEACDALRQDLATHGINIKVSNTANTGDTNVARQWPVIQLLREMAEVEVVWEEGI